MTPDRESLRAITEPVIVRAGFTWWSVLAAEGLRDRRRRAWAAFALRELHRLSYPEIAAVVGYRSHASARLAALGCGRG